MKNKKKLWKTLNNFKNRWKAMKIKSPFQGPTSHRSLLNRSLKTLKYIEKLVKRNMKQSSGCCRGHQGRPGQARTKIQPSMANQILLPPPGWSLQIKNSFRLLQGTSREASSEKNDQPWQTKYYCFRRGYALVAVVFVWTILFHHTPHDQLLWTISAASSGKFSESWRIFHAPARTLSSFQQWLPNQRLHWRVFTSLMTCQLYTDSL